MKSRTLLAFFATCLTLTALTCASGADRSVHTRADDDEADTAAAGATTRSTEIQRGVDMGVSRKERTKRIYETAIHKVQPSLVGVPDRLPQYVELFKREFVEDTRTFAFNVAAKKTGGTVAVSGWVEFDEHRKALGQLLGHLGFSKVNDEALEVLPGPAMCETAYAIVEGGPCSVYDKPAGRRELFTQALPGDGLFLLRDNHDGTFLGHAADGYVGYFDAAKVRRVDGAAFDEHMRARPRSADADARIEVAIAAAMKLLGTKYVWGGRTPDGIDCSGLVYTAFHAAGVNLPRDAGQQSLVGTLVATRWHTSSLRRGDVLFFLGRQGNVSHTGLYLGDGKFIEATGPVVKITQLDEIPPGKDHSRGATLCFGKRVIE